MPASCEGAGTGGGRPCRVHVAFHGCKQSAEFVGDAFYKHAGYDQWADKNDIIVLYPQTRSITVLGLINMPELKTGCWDWFGYSGFDKTSRYDKNFANKKGFQIAAIRRMLDCLAKDGNSAC